ncbi:hypothetical protein M0811_06528 [Anaeramoeba ignava]|uniref:BTB domain-containing protein n=1 Tax=Anaeramoeba ignava TaxID=1746090 RepID=A0A9Q0LPN1_ANAIG|nr:hypothetical protein M0811_06528 [Anaeramoeba ignava]
MENYSNLEKLSNDLKTLFENQEENYFDFEIICQQNEDSIPITFKTHKSILSSRSQYFKSLFNSKMKEFQENKVVLKDFSSSIISLILNYFYSGKIGINLENAIEILIFSTKYLIDELIEITLSFIQNNLQLEIVVDVLKFSESVNFNQLFDSAYQFLLANFHEFIKTPFFVELEENHLNSILSNDEIFTNELEIFESLMKWGKHKVNLNQEKENQKLDKEEKEKLQKQISNVIDKIRFVDFSKEELENTLKEEEDLIPNDIKEKLIEFQKLENPEEFIEKESQNEKSFIFKSRIRIDSTIIKESQKISEN